MASRSELQVNIQPNEILFAGSEISIKSDTALDPEAAQGAIIVQGSTGEHQTGNVTLASAKRSASWSPEQPLQPGRYMLRVTDAATSSGTRVDGGHAVPFFVTDSKANIPDNLRVESMVRLRVGRDGTERLPSDRGSGKFVEFMKASDRRTGAPQDLAFDQDGRRVQTSISKLTAELAQARLKRFGKLHPALHERMRSANGDLLDVAIWLRTDDPPPADRLRGTAKPSTAEPTEALSRRKSMVDLGRGFAKQTLEPMRTRQVATDRSAPVVYAKVTADQLKEIQARDEVAAVFLHERDGIDDLDASMAIANSDDVHTQGIKGSGVKAAVWENGPDDTSKLTIQAFYDANQSNTSEHSRHTHGIVKNKESNKPHGHAPSCKLYSANDKALEALAWACERGCTVISQSFHRSSEPGSDTMSFDDIYKDWLALRWPYPIILQAAGNFWEGDPDNIDPPSSEYVNHKGYNSLAVGNHDDEADAMSGSSVFRNPSSPHGDRELPEICANGTAVTTVGLTKSGTSMAAPAAAGCAALVQEANTAIKTWPEGCRAVLLAGAQRNVLGSTWWQDVVSNVDASDGSGAVDASESVAIAKNRRAKNSGATRRGWNAGSLSSSDFDSGGLSKFSYKVKVPSGWFGPRHVKVALAFTSKIEMLTLPFIGDILPLASNLTVDLDLKVFDSSGNQVGYSGSYDNSYEIAEFTGKPGETYTIRVRRWSGTDQTFYGLAWTVTGGLPLVWVDAGDLERLPRGVLGIIGGGGARRQLLRRRRGLHIESGDGSD